MFRKRVHTKSPDGGKPVFNEAAFDAAGSDDTWRSLKAVSI